MSFNVGEKPSDTSTPEEEEWFLELEAELKKSIERNKNGTNRTKLDEEREAFFNKANEANEDESTEWSREEPLPEECMSSDCTCGYKGREESVPLKSHSDWCDYKISRASDKGV